MYTALDIFKQRTGFDIEKLFTDYVIFTQVNQQPIYDFYAGNTDFFDSKSFAELDRLILMCTKVSESIAFNKEAFYDTRFWEIADNLSDIQVSLDSVKNYSKWLRTTRNIGGYNGTEFTFIQKQNQTLESLASDAGYRDPDNDWVDIATNNSLSEESYDDTGGISLKMFLQKDNTVVVNSVVDNISGEKIYGIDLDKKLQFEDDDLKVKTYRETIEQAAYILTNIYKGSIPEFPNDGIDKNLIGMMNKATNLYPSVFRQLYQVFSKDDTFKSIAISDIQKSGDVVQFTILLTTRLGEVVKQELLSQ